MNMNMRAIAMKLLSLLIVLSSAAVQTLEPDDCSSFNWSYEEFMEKLKISDKCMENLIVNWTESQNTAILNNLNRLVHIFNKNQKSVCQDATPKECPAPAVGGKGGLVCVSAKGKRFCKPMCNKGYDFNFLRISRLYEECSNATSYNWTTQYVGGNKLAICGKSNTQIAGASSAYFPVNQDCLTTKSNSTLEKEIINTFRKELKDKNIKGPYSQCCLMCG
ncbi:hypothetical protein PHYPO_G00183540 [Pangasianodon hypophthalmus]|uniref:Uncharacterized protein n=1 Tax=Pangasianodon hypophthalmus TaxID=310915 RepID=A0A5N5PQW5_PANHP|nr:hypothetical protein PHYPO_G00183540 [Pangasianodon hypophthalmus]